MNSKKFRPVKYQHQRARIRHLFIQDYDIFRLPEWGGTNPANKCVSMMLLIS